MVNKKSKYRIGEKVYSYQNPTVARKIDRIRYAEKGTPFQNAYRLILKDSRGYNKNSNWINENSLSKRK